MRFSNVVTVALIATSAASLPLKPAGMELAPREGLEDLMGRNAEPEPQKLKVDKREPQKLKVDKREPQKLKVDKREPQKLKVDKREPQKLKVDKREPQKLKVDKREPEPQKLKVDKRETEFESELMAANSKLTL
ncbi:exported protein-like protein [Stemphylium lycopersici]|nr:exported protein-like protein [Stemphylium lycopersici]